VRLVPKSKSKKIQFFKTHLARWAQDPGSIGVSAEQIALLTAVVEEADAALAAQRIAESKRRSATIRLKDALDAMSIEGARVVQSIRVNACQSGNEGVYARAGIPRRAKPAPIAPPGKPYDLSVALGSDGSLTLRWKCKNPTGAAATTYQVYRSVGPRGRLQFVGVAGERTLVDETLPAGSSQVVYQIRASRSTGAGEWAQFNVNFGGTGRPAPRFGALCLARPKRFRGRAA